MGLSCGCSSDGVEHPPPINTLSSAKPAPATAAISFSMQKWLDTEGLERLAVTGNFQHVTVSADEASRSNLRDGDFAGVSAEISVDLASIETGMDIRNTNVKEAYFDIATYTTAVVRVLGLTATDQAGVYTAKLELSAHGVTGDLPDATVSIEKVENGYRVRTLQPIEIVSANFGFNVTGLLQRCLHKGLDPSALVQADVFVPDP